MLNKLTFAKILYLDANISLRFKVSNLSFSQKLFFKKMSNCIYRLSYFNLRGRAEPIRILFKLANQTFDDKRIEFSEWPQLKKTIQFEQLPILEVTENSKVTTIAQSNAIIRFLANRLGLSGANEFENAQCDMIAEQIRDVRDSLVVLYRMKDGDEKQQLLDKAMSESVPNGYKLVQNVLERSQSGFLVGDKISYVDVILVLSYDWLRERKDEILSQLPTLKKHHDKICSIPVIAEQT
jgi:glutathione S-transferase